MRILPQVRRHLIERMANGLSRFQEMFSRRSGSGLRRRDTKVGCILVPTIWEGLLFLDDTS